LDQERERKERIESIENKRDERRQAKKDKKQALIEKLKEDDKNNKKKIIKTPMADEITGQNDGDGQSGAEAAGEDAKAKKKRRVSWGTDQVRKFHS
jgi:hypothetical protein